MDISTFVDSGNEEMKLGKMQKQGGNAFQINNEVTPLSNITIL